MDLEKRREDRILLSLPVQFKLFDLQKLETDIRDASLRSRAELKNLSAGGLQVSSQEPFQKGDVLELHVDLPNGGFVRSVAKVAWCRKDEGGSGYHSGIQLIPVYEEDLKKLREYLEKASK